MNHIQHNTDSHDKIADVYDAKHTEIYNKVEQTRLFNLLKHISDKFQNPRVLDYGAGTGNLSTKFLQLGCTVTACDVSVKSLNLLQQKISSNKLSIQPFDGETLPIPDSHFDIIATYSVLHHIPDYISAIGEMIRVCKKGGIILIDHESNEQHWQPNEALKTWFQLSKQTRLEHIQKLIKTGELFSLEFAKTVYMKLFVNSRYEREGDIHVWEDDHIEWQQIRDFLQQNNCIIEEEHDYLLYNIKAKTHYEKYKHLCTDTKYMIIRKK